jgi:hypothetical protein
MSIFSRAIGHDKAKNKARDKVAAQQNAPGGVLNFQKQIDTAGAGATASGTAAQDQYLKTAQGFDPTAAIQKYAGAQWDQAINDPNQGLKRQLSDLGGRAVGAGRLDTGFYDQDQGQVINDVTKTFGNQVAGTAVEGAKMGQENNQNLGAYGERQSQLGLDVAGSRYSELQQKAADDAARARSKKRGIGGMIGGALGAGAGFLTGGPAGIATGYKIGSSIGGGF